MVSQNVKITLAKMIYVNFSPCETLNIYYLPENWCFIFVTVLVVTLDSRTHCCKVLIIPKVAVMMSFEARKRLFHTKAPSIHLAP